MDAVTGLCIAKGCEHPNTHSLGGHFCRKCHKFGHGIAECSPKIQERIVSLEKWDATSSKIPINIYKFYHKKLI